MTHPHPEGGARLTATATIKAHPAAFRLHQLADHLRRYAYRYRAGGESFRRFSGYDMPDAVTAWPRVAA